MAELLAVRGPVRRRRPVALWMAALCGASALGIAGALLVHADGQAGTASSPSLGLPLLHGEVSWPAGSRPAPAAAPRGATVLVAFLGRGCGPCVTELRRIVRRLPAAERPALAIEPASAAAAYGVAPGRRLVLLVDRHGDERTGYAFPLAPAFVAGDLATLARER